MTLFHGIQSLPLARCPTVGCAPRPRPRPRAAAIGVGPHTSLYCSFLLSLLPWPRSVLRGEGQCWQDRTACDGVKIWLKVKHWQMCWYLHTETQATGHTEDSPDWKGATLLLTLLLFTEYVVMDVVELFVVVQSHMCVE